MWSQVVNETLSILNGSRRDPIFYFLWYVGHCRQLRISFEKRLQKKYLSPIYTSNIYLHMNYISNILHINIYGYLYKVVSHSLGIHGRLVPRPPQVSKDLGAQLPCIKWCSMCKQHLPLYFKSSLDYLIQCKCNNVDSCKYSVNPM